MKILQWLEDNKTTVDWVDLTTRWDKMQRVHNPHRNDQIETIYRLSRIQSLTNPTILDLCCGPGTLSKYFLSKSPNINIIAVDIDPFLVAMFKNSYPQDRIITELHDIQKADLFDTYQNRFDAVVSLTALHWLSQESQKLLYKRIYSILKNGGIFVNADPYLPTIRIIKRLRAFFQKNKVKNIEGENWNQYWERIYRKYHIKEYIDEMKSTLFREEDKRTDDGYPIKFYMSSLKEAGFDSPAVYWKGGSRIVYGGVK